MNTNMEPVQANPPDVFQIANLLIARALETHREEIDIIAYYGSYAQGKASAASDLDFFYIPADGKNPLVGHTILVNGILFDFWGIRWDTLDGFATGRMRGWSFAPALVHHARALHARDEAQAARFAALQQKVLDLQSPQARPQMIQRALEAFPKALSNLGNLRLALASGGAASGGAVSGDIADLRCAGWQLILAIIECLALANQVFFDRGWSSMLEQLSRLRYQPDDLESSIVTISTADDPALVIRSAERLVLGTRQVLRTLQQSLPAQAAVGEVFESSYPEIKDGIRKVLKACQRQQPVQASVAAWAAQSQISAMLNDLEHPGSDAFNLYSETAGSYRRLGFPDLLRVPAGNLALLAEQARLLDQQVREWLQSQSIDLCEYQSIEDLKNAL